MTDLTKIDDSFDSEADSDTFYEDDLLLNKNTSKTKDFLQKNFQEIEIDNTINKISEILKQITEKNNEQSIKKDPIKKKHSILYSEVPPKISLYDYISRIQKYCFIEKNTIILALIYIDRICEINSLFLSNYNIHKILFTSILAAIKYNEDSVYSNKYYSEVAGVSLEELNLMEKSFFELLNFKLFVDEEEFKKYNFFLENYKNIDVDIYERTISC